MTYTFPIAPAFPSITLRRDLDRLFDDVFPARNGESAWQPAVNAREDAQGYTVDVDLPGVDPEGVEVLAEDGVLAIRGARAVREMAEGEKALFTEQPKGSFVRRFRLPKSADLQQVHATYANGVLTVRVAKVAPAQPRRVPITVHGAASTATGNA